MRSGRNAPSALEDASRHLCGGMAAARRGRESLPELRTRERLLLREWAEGQGCLLQEDPTLRLQRRSSHGEHAVGFDPESDIWWKTTHPGNFFHTNGLTIPIDGILAEIPTDAEHEWLLKHARP